MDRSPAVRPGRRLLPIETIERRQIGPVAPTIAAAAFGAVGLGPVLVGHFAV